uniref:Glycosyltransferase 2-like domain-containing protein n=1 Tax=viral metagenome TaxID=1070528 RepID=A0A6C0D4I3_9ZZZZ
MSRTVVSFTSIPTRIRNIDSILLSIAEQTYQPDIIIIHYPKKCIRLNLDYDLEALKTIIEKSSLYDKIIINECDDYGPITKIYPIMNMSIIQPDDIIIVIDDDNYYNKYLFECLLVNFLKFNKKYAFCLSGIMYPKTLGSRYYCYESGCQTEIMEASFGYILSRSFLEDDFTNWVLHDIRSIEDIHNKNWENAFFSDDYVISKYLDTKGIVKGVVFSNDKIVKDTCFVENENCKRENSLCMLEHNLDKYFKAERELQGVGLL